MVFTFHMLNIRACFFATGKETMVGNKYTHDDVAYMIDTTLSGMPMGKQRCKWEKGKENNSNTHSGKRRMWQKSDKNCEAWGNKTCAGTEEKKNYYPKIFFSGITANKQGETTYTYIDIRKKIRTHNNKNDNMELKRRKR